MPREGHGSRNFAVAIATTPDNVMPREGHGSRNTCHRADRCGRLVMPREGHGSRNKTMKNGAIVKRPSCPARGMGVEIVRTVGNYIYRKSCPARGMGVEISGACLKWRHPWSCPARGMGVEMFMNQNYRKRRRVMPREGHGSRNYDTNIACLITNLSCPAGGMGVEIRALCNALHTGRRHAPRGAWE